ncbi:MAG: hypothetical protein LQ338_002017 [Usnochroma carphineum]|nr:MAG: hypothetical protein LQ338_002017 [Usnochroma carphineum]
MALDLLTSSPLRSPDDIPTSPSKPSLQPAKDLILFSPPSHRHPDCHPKKCLPTILQLRPLRYQRGRVPRRHRRTYILGVPVDPHELKMLRKEAAASNVGPIGQQSEASAHDNFWVSGPKDAGEQENIEDPEEALNHLDYWNEDDEVERYPMVVPGALRIDRLPDMGAGTGRRSMAEQYKLCHVLTNAMLARIFDRGTHASQDISWLYSQHKDHGASLYWQLTRPESHLPTPLERQGMARYIASHSARLRALTGRKLKDERYRAAGQLLLKNLPHLSLTNFPPDLEDENKAALIAERKKKQKLNGWTGEKAV